MANSAAGTLVANTPVSVPVRAGAFGITVVNRTQTGEIWVTLDGTTPGIGVAGSYVVLGSRNFPTPIGVVAVGMVSSTTPQFSVEGAVPVVAS